MEIRTRVEPVAQIQVIVVNCTYVVSDSLILPLRGSRPHLYYYHIYMYTHSKMQSLVASTRQAFLKYTPRKHSGTSATHPKSSTSISKSDKVLEQLSKGLSALPYDARDRNGYPPDKPTEMLSPSIDVATDALEDHHDNTVCKHLLAITASAKTVGSDFYHKLEHYSLTR
jgi:hypothetical protein